MNSHAWAREVGEQHVERAMSETLEGFCHYGTVRFTVKLLDGFKTIRRCTCSYCRMRGAIAVSARTDDLVVHAGAEALMLYRFSPACL